MSPFADDEIHSPFLTFLFAAAAWFLSFAGNFFCGYATTNITITDQVHNIKPSLCYEASLRGDNGSFEVTWFLT